MPLDSNSRPTIATSGVHVLRQPHPLHQTLSTNCTQIYKAAHQDLYPPSKGCLEQNKPLTPRLKRKPSQTRPPSIELGTFVPPKFLATPTDEPPPYTPSNTTRFNAKKSKSSPLLHSKHPSPPYTSPRHMPSQVNSESDGDDNEVIYTTRTSLNGSLKQTSSGLRARMFGTDALSRAQDRSKMICTTPGALCAGETETEVDELVCLFFFLQSSLPVVSSFIFPIWPFYLSLRIMVLSPILNPSLLYYLAQLLILIFQPRHLPTSRIIPPSDPSYTPQRRLTLILFEFSRLLSIVPSIFGTLYNLYHTYQPPISSEDGRTPPERVDFAISALWAS